MNKENKVWAPCCRVNTDIDRVSEWARSLFDYKDDLLNNLNVKDVSFTDYVLSFIGERNYDGTIAHNIKLVVFEDQWVGVECTFDLPGNPGHTFWTEGDNFLLALLKTEERLQEVEQAYILNYGNPRLEDNDE